GIRPEAERSGDAEFVRSLCRRLDVPCSVVAVKPGRIAALAKKQGIGIEAAARMYRHKAWRKTVQDIETETGRPVLVLTAHTADDMLETLLMRILRGSGPAGLAAMPQTAGKILRPLLALCRSDITQYLSENNITWRQDSSNADIQYFRNRVRHRLIPALNEFFPHWRKPLASLAETQALCADFIRKEAERLVVWQPLPEAGRNALSSSAEVFFALPAIIREEAVFQGINAALAQKLSGVSAFLHQREVKRLPVRRFSRKEIKEADLGILWLQQKNGRIVLCFADDAFEYGFSLLIKTPGSYNVKGIKIDVCRIDVCKNPADRDCRVGEFLALLPIVIRPWQKEDFIEKQGKKISIDRHEDTGNFFSVLDSNGTNGSAAAFIAQDGIFLSRDKLHKLQNGNIKNCCMVRVAAKAHNRGIYA
ncbi:MAG: tRNA lysidine(34) synthetase TilS, partial [Treponema sp.]|nr:tRNA lysidine(34) synthetase TilS [Treponema sp.]